MLIPESLEFMYFTLVRDEGSELRPNGCKVKTYLCSRDFLSRLFWKKLKKN